MENISLIVAFSAGLISFVSPCVLPLVPVYIGILCGSEVLESKAAKNRLPIFLHSLTFVIGFTIAFVLMGVGAGLAGFAIGAHLELIRTVSGSVLIFFGLFMLASLKIPWLNYERRLSSSLGKTTGYLRSLLTGGVFSLAWTPCVGPILGSILTLAWSTETAWSGAQLLATYSLGLGLPFLIIGAAFDFLIPLLRRVHRYSRLIYIIGAALLIIVGILILTNKLNLFLT